jgi:hypothetical protein
VPRSSFRRDKNRRDKNRRNEQEARSEEDARNEEGKKEFLSELGHKVDWAKDGAWGGFGVSDWQCTWANTFITMEDHFF